MLPTISRRRERAQQLNDRDYSGDMEESQPFISEVHNAHNMNNHLIDNVNSNAMNMNNHSNVNANNNPLLSNIENNANLNNNNNNVNNNNGARPFNRFSRRLNALNINLDNFEMTPFHQLYVVLLCLMCCVGCVCSFWFFMSITQIIALYTEWNKDCDVPLQKWLAINLCLPLMFAALYLSLLLLIHSLPPQYITANQRQRARIVLQRTFSNRTEVLVYSIWILQGFTWWDKSKTCKETAPVLYFIVILTLWISTFRLIAQFVLQCCIKILQPVMVQTLRRNGLIDDNMLAMGNQQNIEQLYRNILVSNFMQSRGTPESVINALPTQTFSNAASSSNELGVDERDDAQGVDDDVENLGRNGRRNEESRACAICLAHFENGEQLRILPCYHSFHCECIDQWLRGHRTCPMCRIDVTAHR